MNILAEAKSGECIEGCGGVWFDCAMEVLRNNNIHPVVFAVALRELLQNGRGKFRNIMLVGPANCGKTSLLRPLQSLYKTFSNPSNDKYAWLGVENSEVIFLNDFRWSPELIAWKELLLLLEGQIVHLPAPKNHYSSDISITRDIPIFATGKSKITFTGRNSQRDEREDEMMEVRWKMFQLKHQIPREAQKDVTPCAHCFARLAHLDNIDSN